MTLELHATPEEVMRAVEALRQICQKLAAPDAVIFDLSLALEELASNVVNHACGRDPEQTFRVVFEPAADALFVELRDHGPVFDPTITPEPGLQRDGEEVAPGGWGLALAKERVDELRYHRDAGENVLRFGKRWGSHPPAV